MRESNNGLDDMGLSEMVPNAICAFIVSFMNYLSFPMDELTTNDRTWQPGWMKITLVWLMQYHPVRFGC